MGVTMEWSQYLQLRHDLKGPFCVTFLREGFDQHCFFDAIGREIRTFALRLTGESGDVVIFRRYEQLLKLARATLPESLKVPARGFGYHFSRKRRERAVEVLVRCAAAALVQDPLAEGAALREFLALSAADPEPRGQAFTDLDAPETRPASSPGPATEDTCSAEVMGWCQDSSRRCCCLGEVAFEVQVDIFSGGRVFSHRILRSLAQARELHAALAAEGLVVDPPPAASLFGAFSAVAAERQQQGLGAFLRRCTMMDVHLCSEALQSFFDVEIRKGTMRSTLASVLRSALHFDDGDEFQAIDLNDGAAICWKEETAEGAHGAIQ